MPTHVCPVSSRARPCAVHCVLRALVSHAVRLHMCQVYVCTAQDVVPCVGQASLPVSCCYCFVAGALRRSHAEGQQPPNPKGWTSRSRRTSHLDRPPEHPCRESPGLFVLSLSLSLECSRQWVVNPPAQLRGSRGGKPFSAPARASPRLIKRQRCRRVDLPAGGLRPAS